MKIKFDNLSKNPIAIITGIVIATAGITYSVVDKLIVEHYKLEVERLEKLLDQADLKKNIKPSNWNEIVNKINKSIEFANSIKDMDPTNKNTIDNYRLWKSQSLSLIRSVDSDLKTSFGDEFENLTKMEISDYQLMERKLSDGITMLENIKKLK